MSAEVAASGDNLLTVTISGLLAEPEFMAMQKAAGEFLQEMTRARILVLAADFAGWAKAGDWGDMSFQTHDVFIEKMAIVADQKWKDLVLLFTGKGLRKFRIEFFTVTEAAKARAWLDASAAAN